MLGVVEHEDEFPLAVGPVIGVGEPLLEGVGLGHQFASGGGLGEERGQPLVGGERFAFLDAEVLQHGQEEPVALIHDLGLIDIVEPDPVVEPTGLVASPGLALG